MSTLEKIFQQEREWRAQGGRYSAEPLPNKGPRPPLQVRGEGEGRHPMMMSEIAAMWDGKMTEDEFFEKAWPINLKYCDPPKPEAKIRDQIRWIMRKQPVGSSPAVVIGRPKLVTPAVNGTAFDFVLAPTGGYKEGAFARGEVHLIQGSSGAGKTTLGVQMLKAQEARESFFGRDTFGRPYLVVMQDRSEAAMERTLDRMNLKPSDFPHRVLTPEEVRRTPAVVIEEILTNQRSLQVILIEGLDMWCQGATDMDRVVTMLGDLQRVAKHFHVSIIGTVGAPKQKPKDKYTSPRDRAFGSSAWARKVDTVLDVLQDPETDVRTVTLLLRNAPPQRMNMVFENGLLISREPAITIGEVEPEQFKEWLAAQVGKVTAAQIAKHFGCSQATAYRWLKFS